LLGRIETDYVVPPHTVASVKGCIAKAEGIDSSWKCDIHAGLMTPSPISSDGIFSIHAENCPGSAPNHPMAFKYWVAGEQPLPFTRKIIGIRDCSGELYIVISNIHNTEYHLERL
jgi:hypothetical protein